MTKRLFLAINLPSDIKKKLAELVLKLQKNNKNKPIKWVEDENFHLTLHFLGDTPEEKITNINNELKPIIADFKTLYLPAGRQALNFQLSDSIGFFPNLNDPKVIFLEMKELNDGKAIKLQKQIGEALSRLGFALDSRPFHLHLTLGRVKFKTSIQIPNIQIPNTQFQISSIDLMESNLTPAGPVYKIIQKYSLAI